MQDAGAPDPRSYGSAIADDAELRAALTTLVAGSPVGLAFIDAEFRYRFVNRALAELNGRPIAEHLGRTIYDILPDGARQIAPLLRRVLAGEVVAGQELEASARDANGAARTVIVNYHPCRLADGRVIGIGAVVSEITEVKRLTAEQARLATEADAARLEGVLLAARATAHLLNNDLALAMGYGELLADDPHLPEAARELARQVLDGATRAGETVARLQQIVRLEDLPSYPPADA